MTHVDLIGRGYTLRPYRIGDEIYCAVHGVQVIGGFWGPRTWPRAKVRGRPQLIVCDGLLDALKVESREAISFHWGVHVATVANWRRALGLTHQLAEGVKQIKRSVMLGNLRERPEKFVHPGKEYLNSLTLAQRRELGWATAGDRKWTATELDLLYAADIESLSVQIKRSVHSVRSARRRLLNQQCGAPYLND